MESNPSDGISIEVRTHEGEHFYEAHSAGEAASSFLWLISAEEMGKKPHRLFINGIEFPAKNIASGHIMGYPYKLHDEIVEHINYCIDLYIAFYQD